jgi:hypothetical protein
LPNFYHTKKLQFAKFLTFNSLYESLNSIKTQTHKSKTPKDIKIIQTDQIQFQKAVFGALFVYVLISAILFFFHYPISCLSIIVPIILFIVTTIINKVGSSEDLMFCTIIAVSCFLWVGIWVLYVKRGGEFYRETLNFFPVF